MFPITDKAVQYTIRKEVLFHLAALMRAALCPAERHTILLHCGIGASHPLPFQDIAAILAMPSPGYAQACYIRAVQKTRAAIPGSNLERYVAYYTPPHPEHHSGRSAQRPGIWPSHPGTGRQHR